MATWIDFKELRSKVRMADVLAGYNVQLKVKGDRASGFCPLPGHEGKKRSPSFSVHLGKGIFQCFSCGGKGNVIDLVALMEGLDPSNAGDIRKAALILTERLHPSPRHPSISPKPKADATVVRSLTQAGKEVSDQLPRSNASVVINAPLEFTLQGLDAKHPYLYSRGFTLATIDSFGLGYCSRGLMAERIAIPLHDERGRLIGYAGRIVDDSKIDEHNPKYRFPSARERQGVSFEFRKNQVLYNSHRLSQPVSQLIVVEGFTSTWWLWQSGYPDVTAVMGASCSPEQASLIVQHVRPDGLVWVFQEGDSAGEKMGVSVFQQLAPHRAVRLMALSAGKQPTDCSPAELATFLGPPMLAEGRQP